MSHTDTGLIVDAAFPGGNIIVDDVSGDAIRVHQDLRDTQEDWFYWYFRVRTAANAPLAGRELMITFTASDVIGVRGPAVSLDEGRTWRWLGRDVVEGQSFRYTVPDGADAVRFSVGMPYVERDLARFVAQYEGHPALEVGTLTRSPGGRAVELLRVGRLDGDAPHRVALTCRHHCCEMMASYELEGIIATVLGDSDVGRWLREAVEFWVVPFVDKDGVEAGDQGKSRAPHDHNRDYWGEPIYPTVAAIKERLSAWAQGRLHVCLDLHCPWIRGPYHEALMFVGGQDRHNWAEVGRFSEILEASQSGVLGYRQEDNLPWGVDWNTSSGPPRTFKGWADQLPGVWLATTLELPYANTNGHVVNAETARAFGGDLARALAIFLQEGPVEG